eukprot:2316423-Amphidinium_carterae.1
MADVFIFVLGAGATKVEYSALVLVTGDPMINAYKQTLADGTLPYADFAVFEPHGDRLAKKPKFASYTFSLEFSTWTCNELP